MSILALERVTYAYPSSRDPVLSEISLTVSAGGLIVLDEPTSQLDPVAGDELLGLLRRINDDSDATILLSEHRLERCLPAADRVLAMAAGRIVCDAAPDEFLAWASEAAPELQTPGARLLTGLGLKPRPGVKAARAVLREHDLKSSAGPDALGQKPQS